MGECVCLWTELQYLKYQNRYVFRDVLGQICNEESLFCLLNLVEILSHLPWIIKNL